jgi:hypothetical protein
MARAVSITTALAASGCARPASVSGSFALAVCLLVASCAHRATAHPPAVNAEPPPTVEAPAALVYGAESVPNGRTTVLRMSAVVTSIEGDTDGTSFWVTFRGALSLDRAAPIAEASPSVLERSAIINRGDNAVLTVRFAPGRAPAFRVEVGGSLVTVTIGE